MDSIQSSCMDGDAETDYDDDDLRDQVDVLKNQVKDLLTLLMKQQGSSEYHLALKDIRKISGGYFASDPWHTDGSLSTAYDPYTNGPINNHSLNVNDIQNIIKEFLESAPLSPFCMGYNMIQTIKQSGFVTEGDLRQFETDLQIFVQGYKQELEDKVRPVLEMMNDPQLILSQRVRKFELT